MLADACATIIWTSRLPAAKFTARFWAPLKAKSHGALVYSVGGGDLCVSPVPSTQPSAHRAGLRGSDVRAVVDALAARGVSFSCRPHDPQGVLTTPDGAQVAWFRDPDGNLLSIVQYA